LTLDLIYIIILQQFNFIVNAGWLVGCQSGANYAVTATADISSLTPPNSEDDAPNLSILSDLQITRYFLLSSWRDGSDSRVLQSLYLPRTSIALEVTCTSRGLLQYRARRGN